MTNTQIILHERIRLMNEGKIGTTGRILEVYEDDKSYKINEPEEIHTYLGWKERGFQVQKGQKAIASFTIWKHVTKKPKGEKKDDDAEQFMFMKLSSFFAPSQVEALK